MELKKVYPEADLEELVAWFKDRMDQLPKELQLNSASFIPDLPRTIKAYIALIASNKRNPIFSGQIKLFFEIREVLQASGMK